MQTRNPLLKQIFRVFLFLFNLRFYLLIHKRDFSFSSLRIEHLQKRSALSYRQAVCPLLSTLFPVRSFTNPLPGSSYFIFACCVHYWVNLICLLICWIPDKHFSFICILLKLCSASLSLLSLLPERTLRLLDKCLLALNFKLFCILSKDLCNPIFVFFY